MTPPTQLRRRAALRSAGRGLSSALLLVALLAPPASAYVPLTLRFENGQPVIARWSTAAFPVQVFGSEGLSGDLPVSEQVTAIQEAMNDWSGVASSAASLQYGGERAVTAGLLDGINALEFADDPSLDFDNSIALTFLFTNSDGTILESDVRVNNRRFEFNTDGGVVGIDLETTLIKELGHVLGLDNSPTGMTTQTGPTRVVDPASSVMFPIARGPGETARALTDDDIAGISAMYPAGNSTGGVSGRVTLAAGGVALFGAHVVVFDPIDQVLVGTLTRPDGSYSIEGLPPGRYVMRVQPLSESSGLTLSSFGGIFASDSSAISISFRSVFLDRPIDVPSGTTVGGVNVEVQ